MSLLKSIGAVTTVATILAATAIAGDENPPAWKRSLTVDITTTQTSYSDSWVGGEAGSVNWVANLNGSAERQLRSWFNLKSILRLAFGQTITQGADSAKRWSKPHKSTDLIDFESVGRFTVNWFVDPYAALRVETQFFDGSVEQRRRYFSPLKITESAGLSWKFYENDKDFVTTRLGLGLRQIITREIVDTSFNTRTITTTDGGLESVTDVTLLFNEKLSYTGKLTLYRALYFSEKEQVRGTESEDDWKAVDVNWENIISASLSRIVTVNLYTQLLYDKEVSRQGRLKETLAIGFVFKML